ncbi:hypothetical protein Q7439_05910 [Glaesserella parasuis]|nr:hypothetical protein [Glaesserella parasuis]
MRVPDPMRYETKDDYYEALEKFEAYQQAKYNDEIAPDERDEFCEEVLICNPRERDYQDQTWLFGRKDV